MSSIIDALKKTQSAIDKKPYQDCNSYSDIVIPNSEKQGAQSHAVLLGQKKSSGFSISGFKNHFSFSTRKFKRFFSLINQQYVIRSIILLCLCTGIWLGYRYDHQITYGVTNTVNKIENHIHTTSIEPVTTKPSGLILNGTVHTGPNRDALINDQLYRVGDTVNGYKILGIHYNQVTLFDANTQKTMVLTTQLS